MSELSGKVAAITGASRGIGAAIVKHLAGEGASVVVTTPQILHMSRGPEWSEIS